MGKYQLGSVSELKKQEVLEYLLVQGGLGNHREDKDLEEYDLHELVWSRMDYEKKYYEEFYSQANMPK